MPTNWVAIVAALAAWVAAWQAFRSAKTARRAYQLVLEQEKRLRPSLELYLVEAHIRRIKQLGIRIYVFRIMVTNKSDAVNYLKELRLFIEHDRKLGPLSNVAIPHEPDLVEYLPQYSGDPLYIPCQIAAHAVLGDWPFSVFPKIYLKIPELNHTR